MQKRIFYTLLLVYFTSNLSAQQSIDAQLLKPIQRAISTHYGLKNQFLEVEKTKTSKETANGKRLPSVSATALYSYFANSGTLDLAPVTVPIVGNELFSGSQKFTGSGNLATAGLTATQVIFSGLQIKNGVLALEAKAKAEEFMANATKETIALEVVTSFDQLMLMDEADKLIKDSEKRLGKENEYVTAAIANGLAIPYDRDKIKLAMLELDAKSEELAGNRKLLKQKLATLTHLSGTAIDSVNYKLSVLSFQNSQNSDVENRNELQALKSSVQAYQYLLQKEKGAALPQIFAFGNLSYFNIFGAQTTLKDISYIGSLETRLKSLALAPSAIVGVGVKLHIYSGGHIRHSIHQAQLDIEMSENKLKDTREQLNLLLAKNQIAQETANKVVNVKKQQVQVAKNNNEIAAKQYREGLIGITERLAAENELFASSLNYYTQIMQQRKSALELLHTTGNLLETLLK